MFGNGPISSSLALYPLLLDVVGDGVVAYGCRQLKLSARSPFKVKRSSDDAIVSVYFNGNDINLASLVDGGDTLAVWAGTDTITINEWVDQSGNGLHMPRATVGEILMDAGVLNEFNGRACVKGNGVTADDFITIASTTEFCFESVVAECQVSQNFFGSGVHYSRISGGRGLLARNGGAARQVSNWQGVAGKQYIWQFDSHAGGIDLKMNGEDITATFGQDSVVTTNWKPVFLNSWGVNTHFQEFIRWAGDKHADYPYIRDEQAAYYGITITP